jgi:hypothetical protein
MILARCFVLGGFTLFFLGFAGSREANRVLKNKGQDLHSGVERYVPSQQRLAGPQILLVFLGSSTCMYSNDPDLPGAVEALKVRFAHYADERSMSFKAVGVAVDWGVAKGVRHLNSFGQFDEIASGYNWGNGSLAAYTWAVDHEPATPQVLVFEQQVAIPDRDQQQWGYREDDRKLIVFRSGAQDIIGWAGSGVTIP